MIRIDQDVFEVHESFDRDTRSIACFVKKEDAERAVGNSAYRGVSPKRMSITIFETYDEYVSWQEDSARRAALAKLTTAERKLLGLE